MSTNESENSWSVVIEPVNGSDLNFTSGGYPPLASGSFSDPIDISVTINDQEVARLRVDSKGSVENANVSEARAQAHAIRREAGFETTWSFPWERPPI